MPDFIPCPDRRFFGINDAVAPEDLPEGFLSDCKNFFVQSGMEGKGGVLKTRPGKRAQLTAALGQVPYACYAFRQSGGTQSAFFAAGNTTTGKIYRWDKAGTVAHPYDGSGGFPDLSSTWNAPAVQMVRLDDYLFVCGNTDGKLRRTNVATAEIATGLTTVSRVLASVLTNKTLADFGTAGNWAADVITGPVLYLALSVTDADFSGSSLVGVTAPSNLSTGWNVFAGTVEAAAGIDPANPAVQYVRLDEPGSAIITRTSALIANTTKINANGVGSATRRPVHFRLGFNYKTDFGDSDSVIFRVDAEDVSGVPLASQTQVFSSTNVGNVVPGSLWFSFGGVLDDSQIIKLQIYMEAGPTNRSGTNGAYVGQVVLEAHTPPLAFTSAGSAITIAQNPTKTYFPVGAAYIGQQRLALAVSDVDFRNVSKIALPLTKLVDFAAVRVKLGFRVGANAAAAKVAAPYLTSEMVYTTDAVSGQTYLAADLTSITANLQHTWFVELIFLDDLVMPAGAVSSGQALLTIGPLVQAGNLTTNRAYRWRYREVKTGISSGASQGGGYLTATTLQAEGQTTVAGAALPDNSGATIVEWYRDGGTFTDGASRLVASVTLGSNADGANGYWHWDDTNRVFTDNTPDVALLGANLLLDHQQPPDNIRALGVHSGRLLAVTDTDLWIAQATSGVETGLYWNSVNDLSQPNVVAQGWRRRLTGNENASSGSVQRVLNLEDRTVILFQNLPYYLDGTVPGDPQGILSPFELLRGDPQNAVGAIGARAACAWKTRAWFLAPDGLRSIGQAGFLGVGVGNKNIISRESDPIERRLNPGQLWEGAALNAAAYANASLFESGDRLFLSVPKPGDSVVSATYILDARSGSWYPWELGAVTGGFVFAGEGDAADLYVMDLGGQIYQLGNAFGDTATQAGGVAAVAQSLTSRRFVGGGAELVAQYFSAILIAQSTVTATLTVYADPEDALAAGKTFTQTYTLATGQNEIRRLKIPARVRGRAVLYKLDFSTTDAVVIREAHLLATPSRLL